MLCRTVAEAVLAPITFSGLACTETRPSIACASFGVYLSQNGSGLKDQMGPYSKLSKILTCGHLCSSVFEIDSSGRREVALRLEVLIEMAGQLGNSFLFQEEDSEIHYVQPKDPSGFSSSLTAEQV